MTLKVICLTNAEVFLEHYYRLYPVDNVPLAQGQERRAKVSTDDNISVTILEVI